MVDAVAKPGGYSPVVRPSMNQGFAKGGPVKVAHYAEGGPVLGRARDFVKAEPDPFRGQKKTSTAGTVIGPDVLKVEEQSYPKKSDGQDCVHNDKSLKPVKPGGKQAK